MKYFVNDALNITVLIFLIGSLFVLISPWLIFKKELIEEISNKLFLTWLSLYGGAFCFYAIVSKHNDAFDVTLLFVFCVACIVSFGLLIFDIINEIKNFNQINP